jgi:hypothetical protein
MANDIIGIVVTDNSDNVQLNVTPNLVSINVSQTSGNIIGSNYFLASTFGALPITGDTTTLYVINDTSLMYRWSGSAYTQINSSAVVAWGQITGTLSGQTDLQNALNAKAPIASPTFTGTVSGITKSMVGLSNVDNTSDANKPVSTATQTALDLKAPIASPTFTGTVSGVTKAMVGLGNVDNTSDVNKPISSATQTSLDTKAPIASPTFTGTVSGITKAMVGLGDVDNTSDVNKPISSATQTALDTKAPLASPTFTGTVSGITKSMVGLGDVDNTTDLNKPISTATQTALNLKYDASNPSGYTTNVGTVTSVGGTGTVSGLSLSGTVTTSGNLTLGGTLSLTSGNVTTALGYTPYDATNPSGYISGITSGNVTTALGYTPENAANKGVANGYASLDGGGLVPSTQLPSYVDDVLEFADLAAFPASGATGKIYVALDTNKIYRWSGATYIEVSPTVGTIWGGITGTLSNQTDLQNALNAKQDDITLTTTGTSGAATFISNTLNIPNYAPDLSGYVPYTGATTNVNLGTHSLTAADLVINHVSGSGVAASITKGGNGEALTVVKTSGSGNAASITGGVTLLDELHLNTDLADAYIASATNWNTAYTNRITSLTTTGSSGSATLVSNVLNIPTYTLSGLGGISLASLSGSAPITYNNSTGAIGITQSSGSTDGFLSSTDWSTFNSKQGAITLTTTGTSGAATFSAGTLNIPQYQAALTNPVTGTGTTNYVTKWTSSSAIGNTNLINDSSGNLGLGVNPTSLWQGQFLQISNDLIVGKLTVNGYSYLGHNVAYDGSSFKSINGGSGALIGFSGADGFNIDLASGASSAGSTYPTYSTKFKVTAAGNVGIGTSSPKSYASLTANGQIIGLSNIAIDVGQAFKFNTYYDSGTASDRTISTGFAAQIGFNSSIGSMTFFTSSSSITADNNITISERMRITSAGNVGIGTSSPNYVTTIADSTWSNGSTVSYLFNIRKAFGLGVVFGCYVGEYSQDSVGFTINQKVFNQAPSTTQTFTINNSGNYSFWGSNVSDKRLKRNINYITDSQLDKIMLLKPATFNKIVDNEVNTNVHTGFIAQDILESNIPNLIMGSEETSYGLDYDGILALAVKAIQELSAKITILENK